jgi:serine/threonine protein kinase
LWYRAPELIAGPPGKSDEDLCYSTAVDVWSLGAVVYELIAAEYLALRRSTEEVLGHVSVLGPRPPPPARGPVVGTAPRGEDH